MIPLGGLLFRCDKMGYNMSTKPMPMLDEEWVEFGQKEKRTIQLCILDSVLSNLSGEAMMILCGTS